MKAQDFEYPPQQDIALQKASRLEWWTLAYLASVAVVLYLTQGSSQAMKTAWIDDLLSLITPVVFLVAARFSTRPPDARFPYGYHRCVSIAFLTASLTLFAVGIWLLLDGTSKLVKMQHATIGSVQLGGETVWLGWLMIPALLWASLPSLLLGRAKFPLARTLHDRVLLADADMNRSDAYTALAALVGVLGIGLGFWWADAVAAILISLDTIHAGFRNLKQVICDLMDEAPRTTERLKVDPWIDRVEEHLRKLPWIEDAKVRMREEGHVYFGEAFIVPRGAVSPEQLAEATRQCTELHWQIHDLVLVPVPSLEEAERPRGESTQPRS